MRTKRVFSFMIMVKLLAVLTTASIAYEETNDTNNKYMAVNSNLIDQAPEKSPAGSSSSIDTLTLGGGCFWCVDAVYKMLDGVLSVESGYSGGKVKDPTYQEVCTGLTGHAEVVQVTFDNTKTSIDEILKVFFTVHDPTTLNRQGNDVGTQYRSVIFYRNDNQRRIAKSIIDDLNNEHVYLKPIVTQLVPFTKFYKAEDYHQDYYNKNKEAPYCRLVIQPKIEKFEKAFKDRIKK